MMSNIDTEQVFYKEIPSVLLGNRLDKILVNLFPQISRTEIQRCIKAGLVSVDNIIITDSALKIRAEKTVKLVYKNLQLDKYDLSPENIAIEVLYEDEYIIIINKPAGIVCHPAPGHKSGTLVNALAGRWHLSEMGERPGIVHRLDKDTSGLMLIAKSNIAHAAFADLFAKHKGTKIRRFYTCFVFGCPNQKVGKLESKIARHPKNRQLFAVSAKNGKTAVTLYKTLKTRYFSATKAISKLECELLTGRTHQIRVHMQSISCPLVGDQLYGKRHIESIYPDYVRNFSRQALHSGKLYFVHPFFSKSMEFSSPLPNDMLPLDMVINNN